MNDELKKDIEAVVAEIFSQKEEAEKRGKTEEALQKSAQTIVELTDTLEGKNAHEEELATQVSDLQKQNTELQSKLEAAQKEVEGATAKFAESEKKITEMNKDKAAELRMKDLATAGVTLSNVEGQAVKVREMSDEEFAVYKEELISLRKSVEAELAKSAEAAEKVKQEEEAKKVADDAAALAAATAAAAAAAATGDVTPPPQVDPKKAVAAAMNLEVKVSDDLMAKYAKLGAAMAQTMVKEEKK